MFTLSTTDFRVLHWVKMNMNPHLDVSKLIVAVNKIDNLSAHTLMSLIHSYNNIIACRVYDTVEGKYHAVTYVIYLL